MTPASRERVAEDDVVALLMESARSAGCPACRVIARLLYDEMCRLQYDAANDPAVREAVAAGGLGGDHRSSSRATGARGSGGGRSAMVACTAAAERGVARRSPDGGRRSSRCPAVREAIIRRTHRRVAVVERRGRRRSCRSICGPTPPIRRLRLMRFDSAQGCDYGDAYSLTAMGFAENCPQG
jgi:hypothetical protein